MKQQHKEHSEQRLAIEELERNIRLAEEVCPGITDRMVTHILARYQKYIRHSNLTPPRFYLLLCETSWQLFIIFFLSRDMIPLVFGHWIACFNNCPAFSPFLSPFVRFTTKWKAIVGGRKYVMQRETVCPYGDAAGWLETEEICCAMSPHSSHTSHTHPPTHTHY